jgi:CheY-like chemotaxis protein
VSSEQALSLLDKEGPFDLLLADVEMSQMNGFALSRQVRERCPQVRTLFLSGRPEALESMFAGEDHSGVVEKPAEPSYLLERIRSALDGTVDTRSYPDHGPNSARKWASNTRTP